MQLALVTGNEGKAREFAAMARGLAVVRRSVDLEEIQGTSEEIACRKARDAAAIVGGPVVVEDMALCFDALGGMPGPYVKAFMDAVGAEGLARMLDAFDSRKARDVCVYAFCEGPGSEPRLFAAHTEGLVSSRPRGSGGFGWDSVFVPDGARGGMTYAEMEPEEKACFSARGKAVAGVCAFLAAEKGWGAA